MTGDLRTQVFIEYPNRFFPAVAVVLAVPALGPAPSFVPLVLLVTSVLIYSKIIARRTTFSRDVTTMWIATLAGASLGQVASSMTALSSPVTAVLSNLTLSAVPSAIAIALIHIDRYSSRFQTPWARITFFPAVWASAWQLIARFSPVGHLMTWTPVQGIDAYAWMRPYFGPWGMNWVVAALAVILTDVVGTWFIGADDSEPASSNGYGNQTSDVDLLTSSEMPILPAHEPRDVHRGPRHALILAASVLLLALPSYFIHPAPLPAHTNFSTALVVGCVLPDPPRAGELKSPFERFLAATRTQVAVSPFNILLWPEGAVRFDSAADRDEKLRIVQEATQGSLVGVAFEEPAPNDDYGRSEKRRNGLALVSPKGIVLEYYKRNLVPFVESFPLSPSNNEPIIYDVQVPITKRGKTTRPVPVTASICLDFASPRVFDALPSRPALVLAPARTWHRDVSLAMWEQVRARVEEMGSIALFCDGGNDGVSGIAGHGMREVSQIGPGSWTRAIGIEEPFDKSKTFYAARGDWVIAGLVWGVLGVGWISEIAIAQILQRLISGNHKTARQIAAAVWSRLQSVWSVRSSQGEQQPLLA